MIRILFICFLFLVPTVTPAQVNRPLQALHDYLVVNKPRNLDSTLNYITYQPKGNLNYLYPLFQLFHEPEKFKRLLPGVDYNEALSEAIAFNQDYGSALYYQEQGYTGTVDEVAKRQIAKILSGYKNLQHVDARRYISFAARSTRVIMINESHNKPLHRAFVVTLLDDLYKKGFRYLAMEMLNNFSDHDLDKLTPQTGHYCTEPVAGELVRTALSIGYKLVSYEDTALVANGNPHTPTERDSIQAENIYRVIRGDSTAKMLVFAGNAHIAEKNLTPDYIPMAMAFKRISGIDPLTIDQTDMTEGSNFAYGKYFYDSYVQQFPLSNPSIALANEQPVNVTGSTLYDITIIHPRTTYRDSRPIWLSLGGRRQPFFLKSQNKSSFLVQAYYQLESFGTKPPRVIPADQTYIPMNNGNWLLYLKRGKYIIIYRDMEYKILNTQHVEVN